MEYVSSLKQYVSSLKQYVSSLKQYAFISNVKERDLSIVSDHNM